MRPCRKSSRESPAAMTASASAFSVRSSALALAVARRFATWHSLRCPLGCSPAAGPAFPASLLQTDGSRRPDKVKSNMCKYEKVDGKQVG